MAENYLQFSEMLVTKTGEERTWLLQQLKDVYVCKTGEILETAAECGDTPYEEMPRFLAEAKARQDELYLNSEDTNQGFAAKFDKDGLWLYADEYGDTEHVAILVQQFLKQFNPSGFWTLSYAAYCSKPRISEFGGGAIAVTASSVLWFNSSDWTRETTKNWTPDLSRNQ